MKSFIMGAAIFALACIIAGVIAVNRPAKRPVVAPAALALREAGPTQPADAAKPVAQPNGGAEEPANSNPALQAASPSKPSTVAANAPSPVSQGRRAQGSTTAPLQDPLARDALALVGVDPTAELYWYTSINNPNLSAHERQDLIEDLNEDGLSDPKHPAPEDLPVILNRIELIASAAPYAMDQVNLDAFQEAYKDLINLANVALGGGEPVR